MNKPPSNKEHRPRYMIELEALPDRVPPIQRLKALELAPDGAPEAPAADVSPKGEDTT